MRAQETSPARLSTVAEFLQYYSMQNLAVRGDGSILVTSALHNELWYDCKMLSMLVSWMHGNHSCTGRFRGNADHS